MNTQQLNNKNKAVYPLIEKIVNGYNKYFDTKGKKILLHLAFWGVFFLYYLILIKAIYPINWIETIAYTIRNILTGSVVFYLTIYILIPHLLFKQKYILFLFSLFICIFIGSFNEYLLSLVFSKFIFLQNDILRNEAKELLLKGFLKAIFSYNSIFYSIYSTFYLAAIPILLKLSFDLIKTIYTKTKVENENLLLEVNFLKSQLNPHFLFNALNNIYALTLKKDDYAPELVLKLSEMMRYTLYETNVPQVSLKKEIDFLENYIELQRVRYHNKTNIHFVTEYDEKEIEYAKIAPLLLFNFVENAFKHGLNTLDEQAWIEVRVKYDKGLLTFYVANSFDRLNETANENKKPSGGIGIENTKKRLMLLYPEKYSLSINNENNIYTVTLKIELQ